MNSLLQLSTGLSNLRKIAGTAVVTLSLVSSTSCLRDVSTSFPQSQGKVLAVSSATCQQALSPGQAYTNYIDILKQLRKGHSVSQIRYLGCLVKPGWRSSSSAELYAYIIANTFDANVLYGYLQHHFTANIAEDKLIGNKRDAGLAWPGAYLSEAAIVAYRRTGDERFLQLFTSYFDQVLERRDINTGYHDAHRGAPSQAWSSINISTEGRSNHKGAPIMLAHITHTARITYPATEFARLVVERPALQKSYGAVAARYVTAAKAAMDDFEMDQLPVKGVQAPWGKNPLMWFARPITESFEATNHIHMVASNWINLAKLTGESKYRDRAITTIKVFEKGINREPDGSIHWNYFPYFATVEKKRYGMGKEYSEATWKATLTTPFLVRAYRAGYPVPKKLIDNIAYTIDKQILEKDRLRRNMSSKNSRWFDPNNPRDSKQRSKIDNVIYFLEYAQVRPQIGEKLKSLFGRRTDIFRQGWLGSEVGALGYAHFLQSRADN